jgi:preprotein translocase subunit SecE
MSIIKEEDSNKWINGLVAIFAVLSGYIASKFLDQLSIWFDLEAKMSSFGLISQSLGIVVGVVVFIILIKNEFTSNYFKDVFNELLKVVWPSREATLKITMGLVIALVIVASIFVSADFIFKKILSLLY